MENSRLSLEVKWLFILLSVILLPGMAESQTHIQFNFTDPAYGVSQTTNRLVILQAESGNAQSGSVVLLPFRLTGYTDTNGQITFSNLYGSDIAGWYHVQVPAPPQKADLDIWVQSTNLGLVQGSSIMGVFGAATYPSGGWAWTAQTSDLRYSQSTNVLTSYVQIGQLNSTSNAIVALIPSTNGIVYSNALGSAAYVSTNAFDASGAYTNLGRSVVLIATNLNNSLTASNLDFSGATPPYSEGRVFYDTSQHTLAFYNDSPAMTVNVGSEQLIRVSNKSGSTILNGQAVYISGAQGQLPTAALAIATNATRADTIGLATMNITNNQTGYITVNGLVNDLDTSAFSDGDTVYLSSIVPGSLTTNAPSSPNFSVQIGTVAYSNPNNGKILVDIAYQYVLTNNVIGLSNYVYSVAQAATNILATGAYASTNSILAWATNAANSVYSNNPAGYLTATSTNWVGQYATTNQLSYGTNWVTTNDIALINYSSNALSSQIVASSNGLAFAIASSNSLQSAKQPASTTLTNLSATGAFTNKVAAGQNFQLTTNFSGDTVIFNATNQVFLTNGMTSIVFVQPGYYVPTNALPALTNGFVTGLITNSLVPYSYLTNYAYPTSNPSLFVTSAITNGFATTNFTLTSIAASNSALNTALLAAIANTNSANLTTTTNLVLASGLAATNYANTVGLASTNLTLSTSNFLSTNGLAQLQATNTAILTTVSNLIGTATNGVFVSSTNGRATSLSVLGNLNIGTKTNFLVSTNVIGISDSGSMAGGTYLSVPYSVVWTNTFNATNTILLSGGNYYVQSNGVSMYQSSNAVVWTLVNGAAPAPVGAFGSYFDMNGTPIVGWVSSTNIYWQITNAIAYKLSNETNFTLTGVVESWTTNNQFSTAGTNVIINLISQYGINPTNGISAATATNIAATLINTATNSLWSGITNRGAVQWGTQTNLTGAARPATLYYYVSNSIPQYGILYTN